MEIQNSQINSINTISENDYAKPQQPWTAGEIQNWLIAYLSDLLLIEPNKIDPTIPFDRYNLDSASAIGLIGDLEQWLEVELDPTLIYDYPSVEALTQYLTEQFRTGH